MPIRAGDASSPIDNPLFGTTDRSGSTDFTVAKGTAVVADRVALDDDYDG